MNKEEILKKLNSINLDKSKYIVISGASLVVQNIIPHTFDIDLATSEEYYNQINWSEITKNFTANNQTKQIKLKFYDCFEISNNLYQENAPVVIVDGFKFLNLNDILKTKKAMNRPKDYAVIQTIEQILK